MRLLNTGVGSPSHTRAGRARGQECGRAHGAVVHCVLPGSCGSGAREPGNAGVSVCVCVHARVTGRGVVLRGPRAP